MNTIMEKEISKPSVIKRALALFTALTYLSCLAPAVVYAEAGNSGAPQPSGSQLYAVNLISAEEGGEVRLGKACIVIPPGALLKDTEISITRLSKVHDTGENIDNATASGGGYRFLPAGQQFQKEVSITIPYDRTLNMRETALEDAATYFYDTKAEKWTKLKRLEVNKPDATITSASTHFTDMINATLALPDTASPLELNINSIKGLEAADPLGGMIKMEAPQAGASGDASFNLPLQIPAGRHGMQPSLSVSYSSGSGNGIMGKGFYLHCTSTITTDTRVGLPKYDGHDVYLKDGAELSLYDEFGGDQEYTALSEAAFEKTVRHDVSGDDWWEVTSKDGSVRLYGMRSDGKADTASLSRYAHDGKYSTYTWNLTEEKDVYGNSISYKYINDGELPYLSEINYTGMNGSGGAYTVRLSYGDRQDIILDARGRYLTRQSKRLSSIEVLSGDTVLRKYEFGYAKGISGSSLLSAFTVKNGLSQSYAYRFDYHGLEKDGSGRNIYFADAIEWENARPVMNGFGMGSGVSINGSGGLGIGSDSADVHISGSLMANSSENNGWTESTLADMDGDGLPDAITQEGRILRIWRNTGMGFSTDPVTVSVDAPYLDNEEGESSGYGWSASGGMGFKVEHIGPNASVSVAESSSHGSSEYTCMPCDVDGDGLTDILITGRDTYLRNTGTGGSISFTPARLNINGKIRNAERTLTEKDKKSYKEAFFEQTPFRAWKAPYSGTVHIEQNARLTDTVPHEGKIYARTYIGDSSSDEKSLRIDLSSGSASSTAGTASVTQGVYAWFVLDTGGEPEGTDSEWISSIRYSSVRPFSDIKGLPVPAGEGNAESLINAGNFLPGRISEKQMKELTASLAPSIKAKAASAQSSSQSAQEQTEPAVTESMLWNRLASLYVYDGTVHEFIARKGISRKQASDAYKEFFSSAEDIKNASLEGLVIFGIKPEWNGNDLVYKTEGNVPATSNPLTGITSLGTIDGKTVTVKSGKVYEDGELSDTYTVSSSDGKTVLTGNGFKAEYEGTLCTITYNTTSSYPVDEKGFIKLPEISAGGIAFREVKLGTWNSRDDFSNEDQSLSWQMYSGDDGTAEVLAASPLYGGAGGWYYGIWTGSLADNPFYGSVITGIYDTDGIDAQSLEKKLSPEKDEDGNESYDYDELKETSEKNKQRWYRPFLHADVVAGTESVMPVQDMSADGMLSTHTEHTRPHLTAAGVHAERAGGRAYYNIDGIRQVSADGGSMTIPVIRKTISSGNDRTISGGIGISGGSDPSELVSGGGGGSAGMNVGISESDAEVLQTVQDVTGDGIPDIVRPSGGVLEVIRGSRSRDSWDVTFDAERPLSVNAGKVSHSHTKVTTIGATASASGSVTIKVGKILSRNDIWQNVTPSSGRDGGISVSSGITKEDSGFIDMNGDGIADRFDNGTVKLGLGDSQTGSVSYFGGLNLLSVTENQIKGLNYSLSNGVSFSGGGDDILKSLSLSTGVSTGIGANTSMSASYSTQMMLDVNGDGLPDIVECNGGNYTVRHNLGSSFSTAERIAVPFWDNLAPGGEKSPLGSWDNGIDIIGGLLSSAVPVGECPSYSESPDWTLTKTVSVSGNIGATVDLAIPIGTDIFFHINAGIGGTINASASTTAAQVRMTDLDGDGLPDQVLTTGSGMWWKRNLAGTADLVSKVHYPWNGTCELDYGLVLGTVDSPHSRYCMTELVLDDGCTGITAGQHRIKTCYSYADGYFERLHKDSYGYGTVKTFRDDETTVHTEYANREFYSRHIPVHSLTYGKRNKDGMTELLSETSVTLRPVPYAQSVREESVLYGSSGGTSSVRTEYSYGEYGNVTKIVQSQLRNGSADDDMTLTAEIDWDDSKSRYLHTLPESITVWGGDGTMLRKRTGSYDEYGALTSLSQYHKEGEAAEHSFTYDSYGNMLSVSDGLGISTEYTYDKQLHQYMLKIVRSGGGISYTSGAEWNYITGTKTSETDINGNKMSYTYDGWQRVTTVRSPYDTGSVPAVSYSYGIDGAGRWYAVTDNKVSFNASDKNVIKTVIQSDGLGRALRTAKTGEVYDRNSDSKKIGWNIAGAVEYDAEGRVAAQGQPYFIEGGFTALALDSGIFTALTIRPTLTEYDSLDRVIRTELPDGSIQSVEYDVTASGEPYTKTTDPLGNKSVQRTDPAGNIIFVERLDSGETSLTSATYTYNAIGEMLKATDVKGNDIKATYDMLGRKLTLSSVDGGRREYKYDAYRLVEENSPNLRKHGHWIGYSYDGLNRLVMIDYPETEDTVYTYGNSGTSNNSAGKIIQITDASGTINYKYGKLGETIEETRTLAVKNGTTGESMTATMGYVSNYLGQMESVTYPDGEVVDYGYDFGGQVKSVTGHHYTHDYLFVTDIGYDEFGQRIYIRYGNDVRTDYEYDENRRWLKSIETANRNVRYQNIKYSFDAVGNVLGYDNDCMGHGGYTVSQNYGYDSLYQLTSAHGDTKYDPHPGGLPEHVSTYDQSFSFDVLGNMTEKNSTERIDYATRIGNDDLNYSLNYSYSQEYAHRIDHIGNMYYQYDLNGNVTMLHRNSIPDYDNSNNGNEPPAEIPDDDFWDDDWENGGTEGSFEWGNGIAKSEGGTSDGNDDWDDDFWDDDWENGGTGGTFEWGNGSAQTEGSCSAGAVDGISAEYKWDERDRLTGSITGGKSAFYIYGEDGQRTNKWTIDEETLYFNRMWTWHDGNANDDQTAKHIYLGSERIVSQMNSWKGQQTYSEEYHKTYYYHTDHLGSAQLITDYLGAEYQRLEYTPYGEEWIDKFQNENFVHMPYKFNAKERDEETGLYYYGARYLDPQTSIWLSTDPALGDYIPTAGADNSNLPGMGGVFNTTNSHLYNYCSNNPVRYIDSLGMFVIDYDNKNIEVNLESKNDIKKAEHFYKYNQNFSLTASIKNGDYITFSDYNAYKIFSEIINGKACKAEDVIVMLGDVTYGISEIGKTVEELTKISTVLGNISTALNFLSTEIDTIQLINDPSYSNAIDLISDALGFIPVYGPMLSKEVQLMDWFCETANAMNYYGNIYLENYYLEKMYESYGF